MVIAAILMFINQHCLCMSPGSSISSVVDGFAPAVATWYGSATGPGSGAACGFADDVASAPYNGYTAAGNNNLFKSGKGCGSCYQVRCSKHPSCSGSPITLTINNECPSDCNIVPYHFDLGGKAFGLLAKQGQDDAMRKAGIIDVEYQRVPCSYKSNIIFKIDEGSNPNFLAFAMDEYINGDGDISAVELFPSNEKHWKTTMEQSWGATLKAGIPAGVKGPYSVKITTIKSRKSVVAKNVIPADWAPRKYYNSSVNIQSF
ncbi:LOW QUALITY PROTEIN: expansin-B6-like [Primulina tabacum]|uniref:LOW QUALITY PROTEIN: expansin-B6-like n=1 Tax=Primulina tabacum TaxID=48773 RepID=UPI003F5A12BB